MNAMPVEHVVVGDHPHYVTTCIPQTMQAAAMTSHGERLQDGIGSEQTIHVCICLPTYAWGSAT